MIYRYMVVYSIPNGSGRVEIVRNNKIKSYSDIEKLDEYIKECTGFEKVFVNDFKLLSKRFK